MRTRRRCVVRQGFAFMLYPPGVDGASRDPSPLAQRRLAPLVKRCSVAESDKWAPFLAVHSYAQNTSQVTGVAGVWDTATRYEGAHTVFQLDKSYESILVRAFRPLRWMVSCLRV